MTSHKSPSDLRNELGYPVLDNDAHLLEVGSVIEEFIREVGGAKAVDDYLAFIAPTRANTYGKRRTALLDERRDAWIGQTSFWGQTTNTYDRATSMAPRLFSERMGELGLDFSILYPTEGLYVNRLEDKTELRQVVCRAVNLYQAELFKGCEKHMMPVAVIPCETPDEAIAELDFAVKSLGYRTALLTSGSRRAVPKYERDYPEAGGLFRRMDFYGLDSAYDYDPLWQKMVDLRVPATFHASGTRFGPTSISNNTFNRLSAVGYSYPALLLGLFLGGVVRRFPTLKFGFLEGGAGWLASLYCSLFGVWSKRGGEGIQRYNPANLDVEQLTALMSEYGGDRERQHLDWITDLTRDLVTPEALDDFALSGVTTPEAYRDTWVEHFYAGCEADDFTTAFAHATLPVGAQLRATFGSDIGHWDVSDALECLPEAVELLEDGVLTEEQLKAFLFDNAYGFYVETNPDFFAGTVLQDYGSKKTT